MLMYTKDLSNEESYKLLSGVVVPRPVAWISTQSGSGHTNLAPFSAFTFVSHEPPMVGISIGMSGGARKDTARNIAETGAFVVNIGNDSQIEVMHASADEHPAEISEIELLGLHTLPSRLIKVPRIASAPVSLECRLHSITSFGRGGSEFFVGEILAFHIDDNVIANGKIDSALLKPICRLAGPHYARIGEIVTMKAAFRKKSNS